jgi:hypothetical protein
VTPMGKGQLPVIELFQRNMSIASLLGLAVYLGGVLKDRSAEEYASLELANAMKVPQPYLAHLTCR